MCKCCGHEKWLSDFLSKQKNKKTTVLCSECRRIASNRVHYKKINNLINESPREIIFRNSQASASTRFLEHTITPEDIVLPECCPYFNVPLDYRNPSKRQKRSWNAPSIDRINSDLGYIPGNIQIISDLANRMKTNATIEQLVAFAEGVLRLHKPK